MNILIVDDDILIRNWLKILLGQLKTKELNIYEASDGVDALDFIKNNSIQLVITDIKMPRMDGIELISQIKEKYPTIRICVLSSYDDFSYVKVALKAGALDYILKAEMQASDLEQLLEKVRKDFTMEQRFTNNSSDLLNKYGEQIDEYKKIYDDYIYKEITKDSDFIETLNQASPNNIALSLDKLMVVIFRLDCTNTLDKNISAIVMESMSSENIQAISFPIHYNYFVVLYNSISATSDDYRDENIKLFSYINKNIKKYENKNIDISLIFNYQHHETIVNEIEHGLRTIQFNYYYDCKNKGDSINFNKKINHYALLKKLQNYMILREYDEIINETLEFIDYIHKLKFHPSKIKVFVNSIISSLLANEELISKNNIKYFENASQFADKIFDSSTMDELRKNMEDFLLHYSTYMSLSKIELSDSIKTAIEFINANYKSKITLEEVAKIVHLNSCYLSQLFKKETGISFGDYLEQIRIDEAKRLLKTSTKNISEIADTLGFSSQNYFTRVFKKSTGLSPSKYVERYKGLL